MGDLARSPDSRSELSFRKERPRVVLALVSELELELVLVLVLVSVSVQARRRFASG